jgi:hypothetical protein
MKKEITNDLIEGQPTRAVQLPDGNWITEELARKMRFSVPPSGVSVPADILNVPLLGGAIH